MSSWPAAFPRVLATVFACVLALSAAPVLARPGFGPADPPPRSSVVRPGTSRATTVLGSAWNVDNTPIAGARVQLRNLINGKIAAAAVADEAGRFTFAGIEAGTYVVELVDANGKVITVGHAFVIAAGETVATFVRLGTKVPWFDGFFSNAAAAAASMAASQGVTALAPVQLPRSSR